jgi:flavodoxin
LKKYVYLQQKLQKINEMKHCLMAMITGTAVALSSCSTKSAEKADSADASTDKVLVLYYSQTGATKIIAEELQTQLGADIARIEAKDAYPDDYDATIARWRKELNDSILPEINPIGVNLDDYSTIFLGYPIWGGTYALPVATFLSENSLKGKKVVTFATFGSGGLSSSTKQLAEAQPEATVIQGYGVRNARLDKAKDEITRFLIEGGYIEGTIAPLPDYSAQVEVTPTDVKIFDSACSGYKFPLGTPKTVGKRAGENGTDYRYEVDMTMPDGKVGKATIYVTVAEGADPEFTLVDREN